MACRAHGQACPPRARPGSRAAGACCIACSRLRCGPARRRAWLATRPLVVRSPTLPPHTRTEPRPAARHPHARVHFVPHTAHSPILPHTHRTHTAYETHPDPDPDRTAPHTRSAPGPASHLRRRRVHPKSRESIVKVRELRGCKLLPTRRGSIRTRVHCTATRFFFAEGKVG